MNTLIKYPIGTRFKTRGKHPKTCTVIDVHITKNISNEIVKIRYVANHEFIGQIVTDYNVIETTISMGLIDNG